MCFGMSRNLCVHVWHEIEDALPSSTMISHLLWTLLFLKVYGMEQRMAGMVWTTYKTYKKWVRICYRGDLFFNICKFVVFVCLTVMLY